MTSQRGFSVIELLIACGVFLSVSGAVMVLLHDGLAATPVLEETTDLHQRTRVAADALAADARAAASGPSTGSLWSHLAAAEPRGPLDPPGTASGSVLTLRYTTPRGAEARLTLPLAPGAPVAVLDGAGCPVGTTACGFTAGSRAVVLHPGGAAAFVTVDAIGPGSLSISDPPGGRAVAFPAGAVVAEATEVTWVVDPIARQLRRTEGGGTFVVADHIVEGRFEYLDADLAPLPLGVFQDGPFLGAGPLAFDADLRRVRALRARLRFETGVDGMRGTDPRLFRRPGSATGRMVIPDLVAGIHVALRNGG
jgi:hypothetical protein